MVIVIGEVLIDQFPDYQRIGGAPLNFAYHLHHMGKSVRLVTRVGDDEDGRRILAHLEKCGLATADVQIDRHHPTGKVKVSLDSGGAPAFHIMAPAAYDFISLEPCAEEGILAQAELIYFGSLIQRSDVGFKQLQRFLQSCYAGRYIFCDINLRPPHFTFEVITQCLQHSDILKLNDDELAAIGQLLGCSQSPAEIISRLRDEFKIGTLAVTRGANGSTVYHGNQRYDSPKPRSITVRDTVGAGDAFAALFAAGMLSRLPMPQILSAATDFSAYVCGQRGALPEDKGVYMTYCDKLGILPS